MKILVTGSQGFIGKNLVSQLKNEGYEELLLFDLDTGEETLEQYLQECEFIFHLAGVNRPQSEKEFEEGNHLFTQKLLDKLTSYGNHCPIVVSSSIQATNDTLYGKSKQAMEEALLSYAKATQAPVFVFRLPNVFGKWCRPNYNSAVATFCHNIQRQQELYITDPEKLIQLVYIDDVVNTFIESMCHVPEIEEQGYCSVSVSYEITLGELVEKLRGFYDNRNTLIMPSLESDFDRKLYATYVSYLQEKEFSYPLNPIEDERGYFCECMKGHGMGQISISVTKPGIRRGNHWHHTKVEKFLVIQGDARIRFRKIGTSEVLEYTVSGEQLELVDIPVGYTHSIENMGQRDLITLIWCSESFDPENPDTYFEEV